jgi:hypothetical protein
MQRAASTLLAGRGVRIRPGDLGFVTLAGFTDEAIVKALGAVYVARERDATLSAIFPTHRYVDGDAVAQQLTAAGAGRIRNGSVPYPGTGSVAQVYPQMRFDFADRVAALIERTTHIREDEIVPTPVRVEPVPQRVEPAQHPLTRRRWILPGERLDGITLALHDSDQTIHAITSRDEIVVFRSARPLDPGLPVVLSGRPGGQAFVSLSPSLQQNSLSL